MALLLALEPLPALGVLAVGPRVPARQAAGSGAAVVPLAGGTYCRKRAGRHRCT